MGAPDPGGPRLAIPRSRAPSTALLTEAVLTLADQLDGPVCAHLPVGVEPSSPGCRRLRSAGHDVLLPVVADRGGPLDWARYEGPDGLVAGPFGLWGSAGTRLGPDAVRHAGLVLLPALAADRSGVRLGQGGGFYDRTLPWWTRPSRWWWCSTRASSSTRSPPNRTTGG